MGLYINLVWKGQGKDFNERNCSRGEHWLLDFTTIVKWNDENVKDVDNMKWWQDIDNKDTDI